MPSNAHAQLVRQVETISRLNKADRDALMALPMRTRQLDERRDIYREGSAPSGCCVILSGVAARYKIVAGGQRQILLFHFAGDVPDLQGVLFERIDHSLSTLTKAEVGFIPHSEIIAVTEARPNIAAAFHRQAFIDASIAREWLANVGRRVALERVAHLICECFELMRALGLVEAAPFAIPVTQAELGDATGLSNVHINRTLQTLRRAELVVSSGKSHTITDWPRMREAADFNPAYLCLRSPSAA